ncbi:MAG: ATP-binding cassette domain-containing protein [Spirochaetaceae bacterium]|jgi:zinc transport system ATP-binding protein|nr:ATP-binding cassette domain-containing protein [Spirochaetaceae bacterium]
MIICENASFAYDRNIIVKDINLSIESGDYLCLVGENGSGKSTLLKGLLGLLKPLQGSVTCSFSSIGYLSQSAAAKKDFPAGVKEIVLSGFLGKMGWRLFYKAGEKRSALQNMEKVGVADLQNRCFRELSGGQQRRVLLARTLCACDKTGLLALDEPAAGLDPEATENLYHLLGQLNAEMGITIVMVSHDIGNVEKYAGKIIKLENGIIINGGNEK